MSAAIARGPGWAVLHDPMLLSDPDPGLSAVLGGGDSIAGHSGRGRGRVVFFTFQGRELALRHYRRGGWAGRLVEDRYLWLGESRTRSFREWRMLDRLRKAGLPVPAPVAAAWRREGAWYRADLVTERVPAAEPLSARLAAGASVDWGRIGRMLQDFHAAGACHADLNAHNILVDAEGAPWLLDFDRGRVRPPGRWQQRNLARLERSLRKIAREAGAPAFSEPGWRSLLEGYRAGRDLRLRASEP
jgi:3-deoxy-D-manno-octulosonic acid kinase